MTEPSPEALYALNESLKASEEQFDVFAAAPKVPTKVEVPVIEPPVPPPARRIDLGDVGIPPGLDEYTAVSQQGAEYLVELAEALEDQGYPERALLVYERLLDSTAAPPVLHRFAAEAVVRLRPAVARWVVDPAETRILEINLGTTSLKSDDLDKGLVFVSGELEEMSAGLLKAEPKLSLAENEDEERILPVAVWINLKGHPDASTSVMTFTLRDENPEQILDRISGAAYQLIRKTLDQTGSFRPLVDLSPSKNALDVMRSRITRLQWKSFADTLERNERSLKESSE